MRRIVTSVFQKDPELKGSHSLLIFGICKTRHPDTSLKGNTERERGREASGWETASLAPRTCWRLCSEAEAVLSSTGKARWMTLNWMIHVPKSPDCSPQPPMSPPSPCSAPSFPAAHTQAALVLWKSPSDFPHSCKCIHLLLGSSSPS